MNSQKHEMATRCGLSKSASAIVLPSNQSYLHESAVPTAKSDTVRNAASDFTRHVHTEGLSLSELHQTSCLAS